MTMTGENKAKLLLTPRVWAMLTKLARDVATEVGGFLVVDKENPWRAVDLVLAHQEVGTANMDMDDDAIARLVEEEVVKGREPCEVARVWFHTHPKGMSAMPSSRDWEWFGKSFEHCSWGMMVVATWDAGTDGLVVSGKVLFGVGPGGIYDADVAVDTGLLLSKEDKEFLLEELKTKVRSKSYVGHGQWHGAGAGGLCSGAGEGHTITRYFGNKKEEFYVGPGGRLVPMEDVGAVGESAGSDPTGTGGTDPLGTEPVEILGDLLEYGMCPTCETELLEGGFSVKNGGVETFWVCPTCLEMWDEKLHPVKGNLEDWEVAYTGGEDPKLTELIGTRCRRGAEWCGVCPSCLGVNTLLRLHPDGGWDFECALCGGPCMGDDLQGEVEGEPAEPEAAQEVEDKT